MTKKRGLDPTTIALAKVRIAMMRFVEEAGLNDSRVNAVSKLVTDLRSSEVEELHELGRMLGTFRPSLVLWMVDSIGAKQRGGQKGPRYSDSELLEEMLAQVCDGQTIERAAHDLAPRAEGATDESKARRLKSRFCKILAEGIPISSSET